jgi:hypothetical protein
MIPFQKNIYESLLTPFFTGEFYRPKRKPKLNFGFLWFLRFFTIIKSPVDDIKIYEDIKPVDVLHYTLTGCC